MSNTGFVNGVHYNNELEKAVLGIILMSPSKVHLLAERMRPEYFYNTTNERICSILLQMRSDNIPVDLLTVADYLLLTQRLTHINNVGTAWILVDLTRNVVHDHHIEYWMKVLSRLYEMRQLEIVMSSGTSGGNLAKAKMQIAKVEAMIAPRKERLMPIKTAKYFLNWIDKNLLSAYYHLYGKSTYQGKNDPEMVIQVETKEMAFMLWMVEPNYTWTTEESVISFSREKYRQQLQPGHKLTLEDGKRIWKPTYVPTF